MCMCSFKTSLEAIYIIYIVDVNSIVDSEVESARLRDASVVFVK